MPGSPLSASRLAVPSKGCAIDEAMHPLTLATVGLYGKVLPNQNGAPLRIVMPWKYGFKGAKSIVRIHFTDTQPQTSWNMAAPQRVRLLLEREPERRSIRAGARRTSAGSAGSVLGDDRHADVQRLRRPGRAAVQGLDLIEELLRRSRARSNDTQPARHQGARILRVPSAVRAARLAHARDRRARSSAPIRKPRC